MNDWKHDPHRYGGTWGGVGGCHTGVAFTEVGYEYKEKKGEVCWEFGDLMHLCHQFQVFKAKISYNKNY